MINPRFLPTRSALFLVIGVLWALSFGAAREFVWADLRAGMISVRGLSRPTRALVWIGFGLLGGMLITLVFSDALRSRFSLMTMVGSDVGRGALLPWALVPLMLFVVCVAWSFALAGAARSHPIVRIGVLVLYFVVAESWIANSSLAAGTPTFLLGWIALLLTVAFYIRLGWARPARPAVEFAALLILVSLSLVVAQAELVRTGRYSGEAAPLDLLGINLELFSGLITPFLFLIGMEIASFTKQLAVWTTRTAETRLTRSFLIGLVVILAAARLEGVVIELGTWLGEGSLRGTAIALLGALGVPLLVWLVWWLVDGRHGLRRVTEEPEKVMDTAENNGLLLVVAYNAIVLLTVLIIHLNLAIALNPLIPLPIAATFAVSIADTLLGTVALWKIFIFVAALFGAVWVSRHQRNGLALYLGVFGAVNLWITATDTGNLLHALQWPAFVFSDFWWVVLCVGIGAWWWQRGELTTERAGRLLFVLLVTALLRQTDFLGNRFSPIFGFAGIGFIASGLAWDAVTIGSWTNADSRGLPRTARIFLYFGYVLLTVTIATWAISTHNLDLIGRLTGQNAITGFIVFGRPLLYALFPVILTQPPASVGLPEGKR